MPRGGRRSTTWGPGQGGGKPRPKIMPDVRDAAAEYSQESLDRLAHWMRSDHPTASPMAAKELLDRAHGKPKQQTELTGANGGPIQTQQIADDRPPIEQFLAEFQNAPAETKH